jgi:hypothetical protein
MTQIYLQNGLWCALIGAGVGGLIGVVKSIKETQFDQTKPLDSTPHAQSNTNQGHHINTSVETKNGLNIFDAKQFPNIALDPVTQEALSRFQTYQTHIPHEFRTIVKNLDHLIGIQVAINSGKIEPTYHYRAITFNTHILTALAAVKAKLRNISAPHLDVDIESVEGIARDYLYNIGKDVDQHLLSRQG